MSPRKTANNNKADETVESVETVVEETPRSETAESEASEVENSTTEIIEKSFNSNWILVPLVIISIALFFFKSLYSFYPDNESKTYISGSFLIVLIIGLLIWYIPKHQVKKLIGESSEDKLTNFEREEKRLKLEDDTRKTLAQIVGGAFLIAGLFVTYNTYRLGIDNYRLGLEQQKISQNQYEVSIQKQDLDRRGQITDRFNKAVVNLGSQDLSVRLGGLYALEQILKDSPEDYRTIIEVLSAYIREKSSSTMNINENDKKTSVKTDVQTALTILGRRTIIEGQEKIKINLSNVNLENYDLTGANLSNANLINANLSNANLTGTNLSNATLFKANFSNANLIQTVLREGTLNNANLKKSNLFMTDLSGAVLDEVDFSDATVISTKFSDAKLDDTKLNGAFLHDLKDFKAEQFKQSICDFIIIDFEMTKLDCKSGFQFFKEKEFKNTK